MAPKRSRSESPNEKQLPNPKRPRHAAQKAAHRARATLGKAARKIIGSKAEARENDADLVSASHTSNVVASNSSSSQHPPHSTISSRSIGNPHSPSVSKEDPNNHPPSASSLNLRTHSNTPAPTHLPTTTASSITDQPPSPVSSSASVSSFRSRRSSLASMYGRFTLSEDEAEEGNNMPDEAIEDEDVGEGVIDVVVEDGGIGGGSVAVSDRK